MGRYFSEELIANVKKIAKNGFKSEEILEHITLYDFEDYLFNKNYIDLKSNNTEVTPCKFNEISHEKLIEIIVGSEYDVSEPYSLWERHFSPRSTSRIEISKLKIDMSVIRDGRNIVAHQKKIRSKKFNELRTILKKYIAELKSISMSIIQKEVENEILEIASEDFETVIQKIFK